MKANNLSVIEFVQEVMDEHIKRFSMEGTQTTGR